MATAAPITPPPAGDKLRVIVLGGCEEVGRNCTLIEYKGDIILIDMGLQFPEEDMPGVDYIIPNMSYLKGKEKNIRGVIITHGHYDHIGAIPHTVPNIGNPPIFDQLVKLHLEQWPESECELCQGNIPVNTDIGHGKDFLAKKGK